MPNPANNGCEVTQITKNRKIHFMFLWLTKQFLSLFWVSNEINPLTLSSVSDTTYMSISSLFTQLSHSTHFLVLAAIFPLSSRKDVSFNFYLFLSLSRSKISENWLYTVKLYPKLELHVGVQFRKCQEKFQNVMK